MDNESDQPSFSYKRQWAIEQAIKFFEVQKEFGTSSIPCHEDLESQADALLMYAWPDSPTGK
jgi:hypothetical protein